MNLVAVDPKPNPARTPSIHIVLCTMPNSPNPSLPRILAMTIPEATANSRETPPPSSDQKAPLASR